MNRGQFYPWISTTSSVIAVVVTILVFRDIETLGQSQLALLLAIAAAAFGALLKLSYARVRKEALRRHQIFIVHSRADADRARLLADTLRAEGFRPWLDIDEIAPGQKVSEAIEKALSESAVALLLVSKHLNMQSGYAAKEVSMALSKMSARESFSPVIPVRLDDADVPPQLQEVRYVDLRHAEGLAELSQGLKRILTPA